MHITFGNAWVPCAFEISKFVIGVPGFFRMFIPKARWSSCYFGLALHPNLVTDFGFRSAFLTNMEGPRGGEKMTTLLIGQPAVYSTKAKKYTSDFQCAKF